MSVVLRATLDALAAAITTSVAAQNPAVQVANLQASPDAVEVFPFVGLLPQKFTFVPFQAEEIANDTTSQLVELGAFEGTVEIRVGHKTAAQRQVLEEILWNLFFATDGQPGTLVLQTAALTLGGAVTTYKAPVCFDLSSATWHEEMVFAQQRYSWLEVDVALPALVYRGSVNDIADLQLVLTTDVTSDGAGNVTPNLGALSETRHVQQDGSLT